MAEHRYLWNRVDPEHTTYAEWKAGVPYKEGEVVYMEVYGEPVKAYIYAMVPDRDRYGDRRELYHVLMETKKGFWSRSWINCHPGYVQRGYQKAGLAPDIPA